MEGIMDWINAEAQPTPAPVVAAAVAATAKSDDVTVVLREKQAELPVIPVVNNPVTCLAASEAVKVRKQYIAEVKAKLDPVCDQTHKAWKSATELRKGFIDPVEAEIKTLSSAILKYEDACRRAEQERLRAEEEAARAVEAKVAEENASLMPWEEKADVADEVVKAVETVRAEVVVPKMAMATGVGTKFKPWEAKVTDFRAFVAWCLEKDKLEYLSADMPALNRLAKKYEANLSAQVPGVEGVRERILTGK